MSSSVIGRRISGSMHPRRRARRTRVRGGVTLRLRRVLLASRRPAPRAARAARRGGSPSSPCPCIASRSATTSRARYSVSARLRSARWRSCSICTRSRSSCRFCASRMRGAAYEACSDRIRVSTVKSERLRSRTAAARARGCCTAIQATTKSDRMNRNPGCPSRGRCASVKRPKRSRLSQRPPRSRAMPERRSFGASKRVSLRSARAIGVLLPRLHAVWLRCDVLTGSGSSSPAVLRQSSGRR